MEIEDMDIKNYLFSPLNDKDLILIFPEARVIIPQKIFEFKEQRIELISAMKKFRKSVNQISKINMFDNFFTWFWGEAYLKYFYAIQVVQIDRHLARLYKQSRLFTTRYKLNNDKNPDLYELKEKAEKCSLYDIALPHLQKIKQFGRRITALCPFHTEKTPSFTIYLEQNTYHCFGCQAHGNVITFFMKINNVAFKEAVKELGHE